jgi:hypothetical protein
VTPQATKLIEAAAKQAIVRNDFLFMISSYFHNSYKTDSEADDSYLLWSFGL